MDTVRDCQGNPYPPKPLPLAGGKGLEDKGTEFQGLGIQRFGQG